MSTSLTETTGSKGLADSTPRSLEAQSEDTPVSASSVAPQPAERCAGNGPLPRAAGFGAVSGLEGHGRAQARPSTTGRTGAARGSRPHTDHLGSTTTISESDGRVTGQSFDPFGSPIDPLNPAITRVGFTGQDQDVDLGLTDMKGRIYDPLGGRFTGVDPVMQAPFSSQGLNRYSYVFNDPINNTDPKWLFCKRRGFDPSGIAGPGAGVVAGAAITAFSPSFGSALVGAVGSGANPAADWLAVDSRRRAGGRELFGDAGQPRQRRRAVVLEARRRWGSESEQRGNSTNFREDGNCGRPFCAFGKRVCEWKN